MKMLRNINSIPQQRRCPLLGANQTLRETLGARQHGIGRAKMVVDVAAINFPFADFLEAFRHPHLR
jgi:hypothetical protein